MIVDFCVDYPELEPVQQDRFREVVTRLLSGEVLVPGPPLKPDPHWRFAERHRDLLDAYLRIGGWRLDIDLGLRLCRAVHQGGAQRVRFNKFESLVLCLLRLAYHEQMHQASEDMRCEMKVGELRERLIQAGKPASLVSRRALLEALRRLARNSLIKYERGFSATDDESFVVSTLVERVLPPDRVAELADRIRSYTGAGDEAPEVEDSASEPAEDPQ